MAVLLADGTTYELRRKTTVTDESMYPVPAYAADPDWVGDGYSNQKPDRSYVIALDASAWPVSYGDEIKLLDGTPVLVRTANMNPNDPAPQWDPVRAVDVTAVLRNLEQLPKEEQGAASG